MPVRSLKTEEVDVAFLRGSMYAGQLETISCCWLADTSVARHSAGFTLAAATSKSGSFNAAMLTPAKATPPPARSKPRRDRPPRPPVGPCTIWTPFAHPARLVGSCHAWRRSTSDPVDWKHPRNEILRPDVDFAPFRHSAPRRRAVPTPTGEGSRR